MGYGESILDGSSYGVIQCRGDVFSLLLAVCRYSEGDQCPGKIGRLYTFQALAYFGEWPVD